MRTRMHRDGYGYITRWRRGSVLSGWTLAEVVASDISGWGTGDWAAGHLPMQDLIAHPGDGLWRGAGGTPPPLEWLHPLGMTGLTAWAGIRLLGRPRPGEVVLVSAAAGAVGSIAAQLARQAGATVIVTAGRADKRAWLRELGFTAVLDHRDPGFEHELMAAAPQGLDLNFENVGGRAFEIANRYMRPHARVVLCGLISQYQEAEPRRAPANLEVLRRRGVRVLPFIANDYLDQLDAFHRDMEPLLRSGAVRWKLHIVDGGLAAVPNALMGLFRGDNLGKCVVEIAPPPATLAG